MKFVLTEEEIKEALITYMRDYRNEMVRWNDLDVHFHQSGFKLEHPLVADITFAEPTTTTGGDAE